MTKPETEKHLKESIDSQAGKLEHEAAEARAKAEEAESRGDLREAERHRKIVMEKKAEAQKLRDIIRQK